MADYNDTIYACATPLGGGIAVIRISGPKARGAAQDIFTNGPLEPRMLTHGFFLDKGEPVDEGMAVFFPAPGSYTGEDMAELHVHGGVASVQRLLALLSESGLRLAEPGEFTKRAFLNGKLDLARAEAVMDIIAAQARRSAKAAAEQLSGRLSQRINEIERLLIDCLAGLEAAIDYPEELEEDFIAQGLTVLPQAAADLEELIATGARGRVIGEGIRVVIAGKPNVGKSSLFNALLEERRAIVTDISGTTRDMLEEAVSWDGYPVRLFDTAGIRETHDAVERIGVSLAKEALEKADVVLMVFDGAEPLTKEDEQLLANEIACPHIVVITKSDRPQVLAPQQFAPQSVVSVCAPEGTGLDALKSAVLALGVPAGEEGTLTITSQRHVEALKKAWECLGRAQKLPRSAENMDKISIDVRAALLALGEITGTSVDETVIERIFERFCLGK